MEQYLKNEEESFDIFIERSLDASCVSLEYRLAAIDMMIHKLEMTKERYVEEEKELENETEESNQREITARQNKIIDLQNKITELQNKVKKIDCSTEAKTELLDMCKCYELDKNKFNFGKYGTYYHITETVDNRVTHKISSNEPLLEYNYISGFILYKENIKKHLYSTVKFNHVTVLDFFQFMKTLMNT